MKNVIGLFALLFATATLPALAAGEAMDAVSAPSAKASSTPAGYFERAQELVIQALALIGVNYKWGGKTPDEGLDCSGLVSHVFQEAAGVMLPRNSQAMSKVSNKTDKTELEPRDLVFFNTLRRPFSHVGIYIGDQRFVHAPSRGREVEVVFMGDRYWQKRYNGARRVNF